MPNPDPRFTAAEYAERLARTRAAMEARGIELLIVSDPSNMHWLTGYDGWSFYVHQAVIVPPDGEPIWYGRAQDAAGAQRTAWLDDASIVGYPDAYVQSSERHPMDYLAGVLAFRGLDRLRTGVEMDNYWFSAAAFAALRRGLPGRGPRDVPIVPRCWRAAGNLRIASAIGADRLSRRPLRSGAERDRMQRDVPPARRDGRPRLPPERRNRRGLRSRIARHAQPLLT